MSNGGFQLPNGSGIGKAVAGTHCYLFPSPVKPMVIEPFLTFRKPRYRALGNCCLWTPDWMGLCILDAAQHQLLLFGLFNFHGIRVLLLLPSSGRSGSRTKSAPTAGDSADCKSCTYCFVITTGIRVCSDSTTHYSRSTTKHWFYPTTVVRVLNPLESLYCFIIIIYLLACGYQNRSP